MAVVALLTDVALRLRLAEALKGISPPPECVAHVRDARLRLAVGDVRLLVVGLRDAGEHPTAPFVAEVRRQLPSVAVVAYCANAGGTSDDVLAFGRAGAHNLVLRGIDDERHSFRAALGVAEQRCTAALVYERVRDQLPEGVAPLVSLYLRADGEPPTVARAADLLGVHRKTLVNRLAAAGCPTPRALRTWCRLFVASRLLEEPGRTVESIALQLDFETTAGLRNALKRYTGRGACEVRSAGGLAYVLAQFNAACRPRRGRPKPDAAPAVGPADAPASASDGSPVGALPQSEPAARGGRATLVNVAAQVLLLLGAYCLDWSALDDVAGALF